MKPDSFSYKIASGALTVVRRLPLWMLYGIMAPIRVVLQHVVGYRKKVVRKNLRNAFPEKSEKELRKIEKGFYRHLTDVIAETVKLRGLSDKQLARRIEIANPELLNEILSSGVPVVLMVGHIGNWEWMPQLTMSVNPKVQFGEIYRKPHDEGMAKLLHDVRDRWKGVVQIKQDDAVRTILRWNKEGPWIVGFIADQRPNTVSLNHWMTFMNQDTPVVIGGETIARHTGARTVYMDMEKRKRGRYVISFKDIVADENSVSEYPVTEKYLTMLEETIRRNPSLWLWSHNRWKYKREKQ